MFVESGINQFANNLDTAAAWIETIKHDALREKHINPKVAEFGEKLPPGSVVLDIGAGTGQMRAVLNRQRDNPVTYIGV